jgi:transcriptional regulator GlxA family with amidase domain
VRTRTRQVLCWVEEGFGALDVAACCQVFSSAGSAWNWRAYRIELVSTRGGLVKSSGQLTMETVALHRVLSGATSGNAAMGRLPHFDVVIVASGERELASDASLSFSQLTHPRLEWVGLRSGLAPLLRTGCFTGATVAAAVNHQHQLLAIDPSLQFTSRPWHQHENLWSTATADSTDAALSMVQRHMGASARRAIEVFLGLTTTISPVRVELSPKPEEKP